MIATPVFKAPTRFALLRELARTYSMITRDVVRTQNRLKSVYRSRGMGTAGTSIYGPSIIELSFTLGSDTDKPKEGAPIVNVRE